MKERIKDKIKEIEEFLKFLSSRIPETLEKYEKDLEKKAICERYAEKIIEALVDLAFLAARYLELEIPVQINDKEIFNLLAEKNIISQELSSKLQDAKGMRNILAHEYGEINDEIIYESVSSQLTDDAEMFIKSIKQKLK